MTPQERRDQSEAARMLRALSAARGNVSSHPGGFHFRDYNHKPIWAELLTSPFETGSGSGSGSGSESGSGSGSGTCQGYGWRQVGRDECGGWVVPCDGMSGTADDMTAFEATGAEVPLMTNGRPTVVLLWPDGRGESFTFLASTASGTRKRIRIVHGVCLTTATTVGSGSGVG